MGLDKSANKCRSKGLRAQWWDYSHPGDYFITICTKNKETWLGEIIDQQFMPSELGIIARELWKKIPQQFPNFELGAYVIMPDHLHGILSISRHPFQNNDNGLMDYYPPEQENVISSKHRDDLDSNNNEKDGKKASLIPNNNVRERMDNTLSGKRIVERDNIQIGKTIVEGDNTSIGKRIVEGDNTSIGKRIVATRFIASTEDPSNQLGGFATQKSPMLNNNISRVIRWYKGACTFQIRKSNPNFQWQPRFHDHMIRNSREYHHIAEYIHNNPKNWGLNHPSIGK